MPPPPTRQPTTHHTSPITHPNPDRPRWHHGSQVVDHLGMRPVDPDARPSREQFPDAYDVLARAKEEAEQIRREALVTAEGIRRIALEDAKGLRLGHEQQADEDLRLEALEVQVTRLERKLKKQRRRVERLEDVLLGLAPGLRGRRRTRGRKKRR
jgi:hypothetical protein